MNGFWLILILTFAGILSAVLCTRKNLPVRISLTVTFLLTGFSAAVLYAYALSYGLTAQVAAMSVTAGIILLLIGYFLKKAITLKMLREITKRQEECSVPIEIKMARPAENGGTIKTEEK